jgi:hypothetical protein
MSGTSVNKVDSNATGARYAEELCIGQLVSDVAASGDRSTDIWYPIEPNEYSDFGGQVSTVARNPINPSRQRKKGLATGLEASAGYQSDITQENLLRQLRSFMFANFREKADIAGFNREPVYNVSTGGVSLADITLTITGINTNEYQLSGDPTSTNSGRTRPFAAGMLVYAANMQNAANSGLKVVSAVDSNGVTVSNTLTDDAAAQTGAKLVEVGFQFAAGDLDVDASSGFPALTSTTKDLTELGLIPGEWIFLGGDSAGTRFATAANNGLKRVRSIAANRIVLDKSDQAMATEASTTETVQLFTGRVIKNESSPGLQVTRSLQFERTLGFSDATQPTREQAEYVAGAVGNELSINVATADKVTADIAYVATNSFSINEVTTGANTLRSKEAAADGSVAVNTPAIVEADAFNTSSDVTRIALTLVQDGVENPTPLFAFVQEITIAINNNVTPAGAVGVFGAFDVTVGTFEVSANATAYFNDVAAVEAVRNTSDVTFDFHVVKQNAGISFDLPLVTVGDGRPNVAQDEAVTIPLTNEAASGAKVSPDLDHTLLIVAWPYLPAAADT